MGLNILGADQNTLLDVDSGSHAARVTPYDQAGNPSCDVSSLANDLNALNAAATITLGGQSTVGFDVESTTGTLTLSFEYTMDGSHWYALAVTPVAGGSTVTSTTANGQWVASIAGFYGVRARVSAITGGASMIVNVVATPGGSTLATLSVSGTVTVAGEGTAGSPVGGVVSVQGVGGGTALPVSAASLPLPTGAATSANQTNGNQTTQIVQGGNTAAVSAASALKVDGSAVTQPVSAAALPLPAGASTSANQTNGSQVTQLTGGGNTASVTAANALKVDGSGVTQPVSGTITAAQATAANLLATVTQGPKGSLAQSWFTVITDGTNGPAAVKPASTGPAAADPALVVSFSPNGNTVVATQATAANLLALVSQGAAAALASAWSVKLTDGTNGPSAVKPASTAAAAADPSAVMALSPNSTLYDAFGNPVGVKNRVAMPATLGVMPASGLDVGLVNRILRVDDVGSLRTTSETLLWHDAFEGATVNAFWTQSTTTQTIAQATGVLTLNNSGITTANTDSIITSQRQFPKHPRVGLRARYKANITADAAANHTLAEFGFGAPAGVTAVISNGCFFRLTAAGNLVGVVSYNGTETVSATLIAQGSLSTTSYYRWDIVVEDQFARFIVTDSNDIPVVDSQVQIPTTQAAIWAVSHLPTFARVYVDATGGGTVVKLNIAAHDVQITDGIIEKPWNEQLASAMRQASINPTTYAQTGSSMTAAPATETPSNTAGGYNALGGDYAVALTVASENPLSVFAFQIPSPYTFFLRGLTFSIPFVTTAISVTGLPIIEWLVIANASSGNISTGGGQRFPVGLNMIWSSITAAAGTFLTANGSLTWRPATPIPCLPGTFLHFAYKVFITSAAGTPGVTRGSIFADGEFE